MKTLKVLLVFIIFCSFTTIIHAEDDEESITPEDIDKAGTYFVPIGSFDSDDETVIRLNVTFPRTVISDENQEGIDAHDFQTTKKKIEKSTDTELIALANAYAWSVVDGSEVPITSVQLKESNATGIGYIVTFKTDKGTSTTINVYITSSTNLEFETMYCYDTDTREINAWTITTAIIILLVVPCIIMIFLYLFYYRNLKKVEKTLYR
ncbi:MAG: hypothetical protein ACK5LC_04440 [Coprobacillaceae bacterium]